MGWRGSFIAQLAFMVFVLANCGPNTAPSVPATPSPQGYQVEFRGDPLSAQVQTEAMTLLDVGIAQFFAEHHGLNAKGLKLWRFILYNDSRFWFGAISEDYGYVAWAAGVTDYTAGAVSLALWYPDGSWRLPAILAWELANVYRLAPRTAQTTIRETHTVMRRM